MKLLDGLLDEATALLGKFKHLVPDHQWDAFAADFAGNADMLTRLKAKPEWVEAWKKLEGLGEQGDMAFKELKKDPDFLRAYDDVEKNEDLIKHVFSGDPKLNETGLLKGIGGFHTNENLFSDIPGKIPKRGDVRIQPGTQSQPDSKGYYTAKVQIFGDKGLPDGTIEDGWVKGKKSTFFPDSWSHEKIIAEIANGIKNKIPDTKFPVPKGSTAFQAIMTDGVKLQIIYEGAFLSTVFPNLN